jgi:hypothetical protein
MESVVERIISELSALKDTEEFEDIMEIQSVYWGDPGIVNVDEYPYLYVEPNVDTPISSTAGRAGYDVRDLTVSVGLVVNASDFFDPTVDEVSGSRAQVRAMALMRKLFARLSKTTFDGTVRSVKINSTNYVPDLRNQVFIRVALTTLVVQKQYAHEE